MESAESKQSPDAIGLELEKSLREFITEAKVQGNLRADLSEDAIIAYIKFFHQGIANNPGIRDKMKQGGKYSQDLFSLFMYGIKGQVS